MYALLLSDPYVVQLWRRLSAGKPCTNSRPPQTSAISALSALFGIPRRRIRRFNSKLELSLYPTPISRVHLAGLACSYQGIMRFLSRDFAQLLRRIYPASRACSAGFACLLPFIAEGLRGSVPPCLAALADTVSFPQSTRADMHARSSSSPRVCTFVVHPSRLHFHFVLVIAGPSGCDPSPACSPCDQGPRAPALPTLPLRVPPRLHLRDCRPLWPQS
jgi:hypothetical protein